MITSYTNIARAATVANNVLCRVLGEKESPTFDEQSNIQKEGMLRQIEDILGGKEVSPEESHEAWMETRLKEGWVYGKEKDFDKKTSPCLVPYDELPETQKIKDALFIGIVESFIGL